MPIMRITPDADVEDDNDVSLDVFHVQEAVEVYDGGLALAIDHLFNHIKALISLAYLPGSKDLEQALKRHPVLRRKLRKMKLDQEASGMADMDGRSAERVLLAECQRLMEGVLEIAHLAAWPETAEQAQTELELLRKEVPFLDYRYENDPFPSDRDHEDQQ